VDRDRSGAGRKQQLSQSAHFIQGDTFHLATEPEQYDLVHWNNSLHHMLDVEPAIEWSWRVLKPGGLFYMDDFVGPDRFQWTPQMLLVATAVRQSDPSEAADSSRILECVRRRFPGADIMLTGGVVYHLALSDILANFKEDEDLTLLDRLLEVDDMCTAVGETHYAIALTVKANVCGVF
jgi:SAM-dependent methyltransferase